MSHSSPWWAVVAVACGLQITSMASAQPSRELGAPDPRGGGERLILLVVEPGPARVNPTTLGRSIAASTEREVIRMTDERAPNADGRLTIAFSAPDRWVLRYEARGQVAWVTERIRAANQLRPRLAELSRDVVARVDGSTRGGGGGSEPAPARRRGEWSDDVILALQNEIVDPFQDEPRYARPAVTVLWSEVVDPFTDRPPRADVRQVWSEVLDPWAAGMGRRH